MAYRGWWLAVAAMSLAACSRDTGILVSVTRDPAVTAVDRLQLVIGAEGAQPGVYLKRATDPDILVDLGGRDLLKRPYRLLLDDAPVAGAPAVALVVAVLGYRNGAPIAFAAFDTPQRFAHEMILERDLVLRAATAGKDFRQLGSCLVYGTNRIVSPDGCPECDADSQCLGLRGAPTCAGGSWQCVAGVCTQTCATCLDTDPPRDCYSGLPAATRGVGVCRDGKQWCAGGAWGPCIGQVIPSPEACNGQDDDCNGLTDDGLGTFSCGIGACRVTVPACHQGGLNACTPGTPAAADACDGTDGNCDGAIDEGCGCVKVSPTGNDATAIANNNATPFLRISAAVTWASTGVTRPHVVCVADRVNCTGTATPYDGSLTMANGIDVYGGYESTNFTRCPSAITGLKMTTPEGVLFPSTVVTPTVLDGFSIQRFVPPAGAQMVAGVSVLGAKNVILSNLSIVDGPVAPTTYAVDISGGAQVEIIRSQLVGGGGATLSAAVRALNSRVDIRQNCNTYDTSGACIAGCSSSGAGGVLIGRSAPGGGASYAVLLDGAVGSTVEQSKLCGNGSTTSAALRVQGDGSGIVIRQNTIADAGGIADAHGLWLEDCLDAAPWIVDNASISTSGANASTRADGIHAFGACHPVIDGNLLIVGGGEGNAASANGVHCGANPSGVASRCTVLGNDKQLIQGSAGGFPPASTGVRCDDGACLRVERNQITGHMGGDVVGLALSHAFTFVDRNTITGGCGTISATAVDAVDSAARLQSNLINAGTCSNLGTTVSPRFIGLHARLTGSGNQLDVHSNDLDGDGDPLSCVSIGVLLESASPAPAANVGIFRNNIVRAGSCPSRFGWKEADATADPRVLDHNDFDPSGTPTALFLDEGTTSLPSAAAINALADAPPGGNLSADPMFVSYPNDLHLGGSSMCIGAGSTVDVPIFDLDGRVRKSPPAIGAYESN